MKLANVEPSTLESQVANLKAASVEKLRSELARALQLSVEHLIYLAAVWRELEHRGEDLSGLRGGIATYLPEIASGRLDAAAVIKFAGQTTLLKAISALPIEQQARIVNGQPISVVTIKADGTFGEQPIPAEHMTAMQVRIAFDGGRIRPPAAQQTLLESQRLAHMRRPVRANAGKAVVRPDFATGTILVGRTRLKPGELLAALATIYRGMGADAPAPGETQRTILIPLSEDEHRAMKTHAAEAGIPAPRLARGILGSAGLLR